MVIRLVPVILSSIVLGAHFLRGGNVLIAVAIAASPLLLLARRQWALWTVQAILALGALEWIRTLASIAAVRQAQGMPWLRMAVILGVVAAVTLASAFLLSARKVRERVVLSPELAEA
ncbi:MAG: hypothetical protein L6R30_09385 [Thermoanaerobaculia bacterium]|nr:hypothetical protein [Thermoanaerobaculia bacterium]